MTQHSAYVWHLLHCRWHHTHSITPNQNMYNVTSSPGMKTQPLCQTRHPLYLYHQTIYTDISSTFVWHHTQILGDIIWTIYNITLNLYVNHTTVPRTSQTLYMKPHPVWLQHIHLTCDITATIWVITPTVQVTSHPLFLWHDTRHKCGIVCIIQDITSSLFDLKSQCWGHNTHCIRYRVHCICVITPTLSMISQPLYVWYCIQYRWDILSTIFMTSYQLCMTS